MDSELHPFSASAFEQRKLFKELRDLKQVDATNAVAAAGAEGAA